MPWAQPPEFLQLPLRSKVLRRMMMVGCCSDVARIPSWLLTKALSSMVRLPPSWRMPAPLASGTEAPKSSTGSPFVLSQVDAA